MEMKSMAGGIEEIFMEIAFAEEGENKYLKNSAGHFTEQIDELFTAVTFAEAGEFDAAMHFIGGDAGVYGRSVGYCKTGLCVGRA